MQVREKGLGDRKSGFGIVEVVVLAQGTPFIENDFE